VGYRFRCVCPGIQSPISFVVYNGRKFIVDGHHRVAAAKIQGINVPSIEVCLPYGGYKEVDDLFGDSEAELWPTFMNKFKKRQPCLYGGTQD